MAMDGVLRGYDSKDSSFALAVTADGGGSARTGKFKDFTDEMMKEIRIKEQEKAAEIGRYNKLYLLGILQKKSKIKITKKSLMITSRLLES